MEHRTPHPPIEAVFFCPGCDQLTPRWADLQNTTCACCAGGGH